MNKKLRLSLALVFGLMLSTATRSQAQIVSMFLTYVSDSFNSYCVTPTTGQMYVIGVVGGTVSYPDSVDIEINYDDGTDTAYKTPIQQGYFYVYHPHTYYSAGTYTPKIKATTSNNLSDSVVGNQIVISNTCGSLHGTVYLDQNNNCTKDAGELPLLNTTLTITNTTTNHVHYAYTDTAGDYYIDIPDGYTYTVTPYLMNVGSMLAGTCPSTGTANVTIMSGVGSTQDFGYDCTAGLGDLSATGWATNWREGFSRPITLHVNSNTFCDSFDAVVTVTVAPPLSLNTTWSIPPTSQTATSATWNAVDISMFHQWTVFGSVYCDTSATQGDTLCATMTITPSPADANAANNTYNICAAVNNSYDPNDKQVSPKGIGTPGHIANNTRLTYLVRFQNTGNDTAYTVIVTDTLDNQLDLTSLRMVESSHPMIPSMDDNGVLKMRFDQIYLPDSNVNEPASHGYVIYSVMPKAGLATGTQITNKANIYFDYNPAVVTNTTLNTIGIPQTVQQIDNGKLTATVFPNPANNSIQVSLSEKEGFTASLHDMTGRTVMTASGAQGKATIQTTQLPAGIYLLRIISSSNQELSTRVLVRH